MAVRITTWNVNGIRNPFAYQPWIDLRTYAAMFETLEADIIVFQELKIQKRDLKDDMVLVPGWDCYFTFPKHKKGYSGVAIYTRQAKVTPMKAEEGITGILSPVGLPTAISYLSLPPSEQIGGYPDLSREDALLLDSEGRALVLDLGAFVLIGAYCPANRDVTRDDFRHEFVRVLLERCRNLIKMGRKVVLTGDLNIARDEIDSAHAKDVMRQQGLKDFKDTPVRQMFHRFLEPHPEGVMVDLCRERWPDRRGMYTCWEQRIQARPGNYGARIDYVLCSSDVRTWFCDANIQEGLMGSDHCPVYATLHSEVPLGDGETTHLLDILNPKGKFINGVEQSEFQLSKVCQQPKLSGRLLPEFATRRSIKDMFSRKASGSSLTPPGGDTGGATGRGAIQSPQDTGSQLEGDPSLLADMAGSSKYNLEPNRFKSGSGGTTTPDNTGSAHSSGDDHKEPVERAAVASGNALSANQTTFSEVKLPAPAVLVRRDSQISGTKRGAPRQVVTGSQVSAPPKRLKASSSVTSNAASGAKSNPPAASKQASLAGFFRIQGSSRVNGPPDSAQSSSSTQMSTTVLSGDESAGGSPALAQTSMDEGNTNADCRDEPTPDKDSDQESEDQDTGAKGANTELEDKMHDPVAESKESWLRLFTKKQPPRCEGHGEPCKMLTTKKAGQNCGRAFWICAR
ncbi:Endonuclease/exonuclease/phosphatase [Kalaharituber pfeilii]|nr:Endonuclease/exonuclease/phosphatase [Kalaharituber pfeilii]